MKSYLTFTLLFLFGFTGLHAQLQTAYVKFYNDSHVDSTLRMQANSIITLENGGFALVGRQNFTDEDFYRAGVFIMDDQGNLVSSTITAANGNATTRVPIIAEGDDGTIWVAYSQLDTADGGSEVTQIIQYSSDLSSVLAQTTFDLLPGSEDPQGMRVIDGQLIIATRTRIFNNSTGFSQNAYLLTSLNASSLAIENQVNDVLPAGSFSSTAALNISVVDSTTIAISIRSPDTTGVANDLMIREFALSDFSQTDEYLVTGIGRDSYSMDIEYVPELDAYAATNRTFNTFLIQRGTGSSPTIDTVAVPAGLSGSSFRSTIVYYSGSIYVLGRNAYRIDLSMGSVDSTVVIENYQTNNTIANVKSNGDILNVNNNSTITIGVETTFYVADSASVIDTVVLAPPTTTNGVGGYFGAFPFSPLVGTPDPFLGIHQFGEIGSATNTWGYELVDANTGDLNGQTVTTNDIVFWENSNFDPFMASPLVAVGDGYMCAINEGPRVTFFRFDDSLRSLDPFQVGFGAAQFDPQPSLFGENILTVAPTSYGILGTTFGGFFDGVSFVYKPYVFAADTVFNTRIATTIDTVTYYPFGRFHLAVDTSDQFYTAAAQAVEGNQFTQTDTLVVAKHDVDGSIVFLAKIQLPNSTFISVYNSVLSNDLTELLVSGVYQTETENIGFYVRINTADGSVIEQQGYSSASLGFGNRGIIRHLASYDPAGNINLALQANAIDPVTSFNNNQIRVIQIDTSGNILADETVLKSGVTSVSLSSFKAIEETLYLGGQRNRPSGLDRDGFLIRLNTGNSITCEASSSVSNVSLNGMATEISVADTGATVEITFDYELANSSSCPNCIRQIVFGYENEAIDCAYDGIPVVCSDSTTAGNFTGTFTAPTEAGTYEIFWGDDFNFSCADAKENYGNLEKTPIATITVNCSATSSVSNVSLNGMGTDVSVADTGTVIEIAFDYALSNPSTCPTCIRQIVFGYENEAIDCAYDDIPVVCSDSTTAGSFTGTFVAPTEAGTYEIFWGDDFNFSCNDAKENYANLEKTPIATITVNCSGSSSVSNVSLDGMGTDLSVVDTGATVEISFDYELANPESCPTCIRQIVFGYENEAIDCAYDDIPVVCSDSATMGTFTGTFIAPTETGTYEIFWADDFNFTCADAKENYGNLGKTAIATLTVTMVSSQENIEALSTIAKVYPNPATDLLTVEIQNGSLQDMKLSIINLMGQQVLSEVYTRDLSARKELNIDHLPKGTYYLQIQTADKMYTGKISIQ